jgi:hypothetical protein
VLLDVVLGRFGGVLSCVQCMAVRQEGVMGGLLVIARFVVFGGFAMVLGRVFVVFGCVFVVLGAFVRHGRSSSLERELALFGSASSRF